MIMSITGIAAGFAGKSAAAKGSVWFSSQEKDKPKPQWEEVKPGDTLLFPQCSCSRMSVSG